VFRSTVKRIVITASAASIITLLDHPKVFDESDWNEQAIEAVEKDGKNTDPFTMYRASKTLAEKGAFLRVSPVGERLTKF
jgi:nucleoside-diphosphate-sugar epimerase